MGNATRFCPEVRERAIRLVVEQEGHHESQWAAIRSVAVKIGCSAETLRSWIRQAERDHGKRPGLTTDARDRLKELEKENRELKRVNEILRLASAYFAKAELDRKKSSREAYVGRFPCSGANDLELFSYPPGTWLEAELKRMR
jgi:transposase